MGMIHVLMLSRATEAQVTIEELCELMRQIAINEGGQELRSGADADMDEGSEGGSGRGIPHVDFW